MIDGYWEVMSIFREPENWLHEADVQVLGPRMALLVLAAWPHDYLEYWRRFDALFTHHPYPKGISPIMEYDEWCEYVDKLHALAARCIDRERAPESNRKYRGMMIKLLCVEGERAPTVD